MNETRLDLIKAFRDRQDKFVYYLMGLNVAAIGFAFSETREIKLEPNHIFLLFAMFSWLGSMLFAFSWIHTHFNSMIQNIFLLEIEEGHLDGKKISEENKEYTKDLVFKVIDKKSKRAAKAYEIMLYLFILGIILFLFWRISELYKCY